MKQNDTPAGDPLAPKLTYKLRSPVNVGGNLLTEVTCREATAEDLAGFKVGTDGIELGEILDVIARCSAIPRPHLGKIKAHDALQMVQTFGPFLGLGAETGESD